eukprot:scaffold762_cov363-Pavlova_lutheri.AAC.70
MQLFEPPVRSFDFPTFGYRSTFFGANSTAPACRSTQRQVAYRVITKNIPTLFAFLQPLEGGTI